MSRIGFVHEGHEGREVEGWSDGNGYPGSMKRGFWFARGYLGGITPDFEPAAYRSEGQVG